MIGSARAPMRVVMLLLSLLLAACGPRPLAMGTPASERAAMGERLGADITVLASDALAGRKPGTPGEEATLAYLEQRMGEAGLVSGTSDPGSYWRMPVDLVATRAQTGQITLVQGRTSLQVPGADAVVLTPRRRALATSGPGTGVPVVFVGRGDGSVLGEAMAGAVAVMLGEPGRDAARRDALFAQGTTAVVTIVPDASGLGAVRAAARGEKVQLASDEVDTLSAFVTDAVFARVLGKRRWDMLKRDAAAPDFSPIEINLAITIEASAERREFSSHNLVGMIPGTDPAAGAVLLLAHWDHLGECAPPEAFDRICNGAVDNASGLAVMLEAARRVQAAGPLPRDVYVLATTSEEAGLLGARAFAANPPLALPRIVAAFNFDMLALAPAGAPVGFIGAGRTPMDPLIREIIAQSGRTIGDTALAESFATRHDGWALLQEGVPTVLVSSAFGSRALLEDYLAQRYHRPTDEAAGIELGGAIDDVLLHEALVRAFADPARYQPPQSVAP